MEVVPENFIAQADTPVDAQWPSAQTYYDNLT
jgi:hypothetical protein